MPNAFRSILIMPTHLCHNIVAAKDPATGEVRYWQVYAALFGFESAVYGFGRWSAFLKAAGRRTGCLLWSMYVDDGASVEPAESADSAQVLINRIFELLGTPLSEDKRSAIMSRRTTSSESCTTSARYQRLEKYRAPRDLPF